MKTNCTLIIISGIILLFNACTKNGVSAISKSKTLDTSFTTTPITASIIGKWNINKQRVQILTASTGVITDTTYSAASFNSNSYYQFNSDSTATFAQGTIFFSSIVILVNGNTQNVTPIIFTYNTNNSILTVKYKYYFSIALNTNPGPYPLNIVQLDANTLVIHGINSTVNGSTKTVLDTYLTRAQ